MENIFPIFSFSNKLWFCPVMFSRFLFGQPLPIFVVLNFPRESIFQKCLLLFYPRLNACLIPSSAKSPDEKSVGDFQSWESNRGQQWLSRTGQIKNFQGFVEDKISFCLRLKLEETILIFSSKFFRTMSAYRWRDFTTEKRKKKYQIII